MSYEVDNQVELDFSRARLRAFLHAVSGTLRRQPTDLLSFDEVRSRIHVRGQVDLGIRAVPLDRIVGSEGRYTDFDRLFLPRSEQTEARWKSIGRAHYLDIHLPPVDLYEIGAIYFVRDGNHRVSVARLRGQSDIDAHVIELKTDLQLTPELTAQDLIHIQEQSDFLQWTGLAQLRPDARIVVSESGGYLNLLRHINGHRYFLGMEQDGEVDLDQAVTSWYDRVYMPLVSAVSWSGILQAFPGRTEADLYLWIMDHRHYLTQQAGHDPGAEEAVIDYGTTYGTPRARRLLQKRKDSEQERQFVQWSQLNLSRPGAPLHLTDPDDYAVMRRHIDDHRYYLGQERRREVPPEEAAASWYDRVFVPVVEALTKERALPLFAKQTVADLYLLVMAHLSSLKDQGVEIDARQAAEEYAARFGKARTWVLVHALHHARRLLRKALVRQMAL